MMISLKVRIGPVHTVEQRILREAGKSLRGGPVVGQLLHRKAEVILWSSQPSFTSASFSSNRPHGIE
jgi:hypothetical protein